ncbi:SLOG family protein [Paenibacillus sp. HJGM_3]|uniref:SLOG family protein n=1 Tax=Paenibacillus sp. HJGM_3 TaxID=3379816 RepID=UPI00385CD0B1
MLNRVLVTGYRATELGIFSLKHPGVAIIKKAITKQLIALLEEGLEWVIVSGQWGVELWAAEAALALKPNYPQLRLAVITPFLEQDEKWSEEKRGIYSRVVQQADYVGSVTKTKYEGTWQFVEKDKFLLRNSDALLLLYDEEMAGSPRFIKRQAEQMAERREYPIFVISAYDLQNLADEERLGDF